MASPTSIYFLDDVYPLSKCVTLSRTQNRPVVVSFYVKHIPGNRCQDDRIQAIKQEIETLEAEIDPKESDPKRMSLLQDKQQKLAKTEYLVNREVSLLRGYSRQWKAPNALYQYAHHATFLMMPLDIEDRDEATFIARQYGITRIPSLCGITMTGVVERSQRRLMPDEIGQWLDELLKKCDVRL